MRMPSSFRVSLREFVFSILPMSVNKNPDSMAVPLFNISIAVVIWFELVMALLCPWNSDSKAAWRDLLGYRIDKVRLCKNRRGSEHEFILVDLSNENNQSLCLRVERAVGERRDSQTTSPSSSMTSFESCSEVSSSSSFPRSASPSPYQSKFSKLSLSIPSLNEGLSKATDSLQRAVRRLSNTFLPRPSVISSNSHIAADTVTNINTFPKKARVIRTIDFSSADRARRPSLWDLMIISYVVHQESVSYDLFGHQCFWFADTISGIFEKWTETCDGASVKQAKNATGAFFLKLYTNSSNSSGSIKGFPIHHRNHDDIEKAWTQFLKQREVMNRKCQSFEDMKAEETRKTEELAGQVEKLRQQQAQERQKWETERKEWQQKELLLMKEQEEREHRLRQQIAEQERDQQRLQQRLRENGSRFQEIDEKLLESKN